MGIEETLKKYSWIVPLIQKADRETRSTLMKNIRQRKKNFFPKGDFKADVDNLIKCMLCPNLCRFDCGSLLAASTESMSPAYKSRIAYYLSIGKLDPADPTNKEFIDLMYKCSNEESCKLWCPFNFSVVSLLETVRDDLNTKGLMPEYVKPVLNNLHKTNTVEDHDIFKTYKEKGIDNVETGGEDDVFFHIGCISMRFPLMVQSYIDILKKAGVKFSTNLEQKACCGAPAFTIRDLDTAKKLAEKNLDMIEKSGAKLVVADCPGCASTMIEKYNDIGVKVKPKIIHIVKYIAQLIEEGKLHFEKEIPIEFSKVTVHDPCHLSRNLGDLTSLRRIFKSIKGLTLLEPMYSNEFTHCCGWSGALHWADQNIALEEASNRVSELKDTGANVFVSACPLCEVGLEKGLGKNEKNKIRIIDISELLMKVV
jgi:Fe-S oxidoreductase